MLTVEGLEKRFRIGPWWARRTVHAVAGVSFHVDRGESLGLVGESGCGKSTVARAVLRLVEPDGGKVDYAGTDLRALPRAELTRMRRRLQIIFQDPYASLNPRRTVRQTLAEPLRVHGFGDIDTRVGAALDEVGLSRDALRRYPHEFSGGQRQRLGIARALILEPELVVADEPVSALDVSVQAQILRLLAGLRRRRGLAFLFVSHDLGVVRHFCDRVAVMYLGHIVETGAVPAIFDRPLHPYTRMLRAASPVPDPKARFTLPRVEGEIPSATRPPPGCPFHTRCPEAMPVCREVMPAWTEPAPGQGVACHLYATVR